MSAAETDIVIAGGGNAALCAAISAARAGASVTLLESAPRELRGGNSQHTRNFRVMHDGPLGVLSDSYSEDEFLDDLLKVTGGKTDEALARLCIRSAPDCYRWMEAQGIRFQDSLSGTLSLSRTNAFFLGGGKALINALYRTAERLGVDIRYGCEVTDIELSGIRVQSLTVSAAGGTALLRPEAVVVASGGFESNTDWLEEAWGPAARNFLIRGTAYNKGRVLKSLLDQGVQTVADPTQMHCVAVDGRAPKYDGGIVTRLDCVPFSAVLNQQGKRFYDEGEDVWPKRYAIWGRLIAAQPDQIGYVIIDSRARELFMPSVFPPVSAQSLPDLMAKLGLPVAQAMETLNAFNAACPEDASGFSPQQPDGLATRGLTPDKTNWARRISEPPFYAYTLRPGVTFTYLGVKTDAAAQVQGADGPLENLWAAGEIMAGNILGQGYLAGFGMTIGTVFGRIAGQEAAAYVRR